jgi:hypothetical protein
MRFVLESTLHVFYKDRVGANGAEANLAQTCRRASCQNTRAALLWLF